MKNISIAKTRRDYIRSLSAEGPILIIIEEGSLSITDVLSYSAHTILRRKGNSFVIQKARDYVTTHYGLAAHYRISYKTDKDQLDFIEVLDKIYSHFAYVIILEKDTETIVKTDELPKNVIGKGMTEWYFKRRGYFVGKKFGL
jgi:hypothetical protein